MFGQNINEIPVSVDFFSICFLASGPNVVVSRFISCIFVASLALVDKTEFVSPDYVHCAQAILADNLESHIFRHKAIGWF